VETLEQLAFSLRSTPPGSGQFFTLPTAGTGFSRDGQSIILQNPAATAAVAAALASGTLAEYIAANELQGGKRAGTGKGAHRARTLKAARSSRTASEAAANAHCHPTVRARTGTVSPATNAANGTADCLIPKQSPAVLTAIPEGSKLHSKYRTADDAGARGLQLC
jgi:hypothetical protein